MYQGQVTTTVSVVKYNHFVKAKTRSIFFRIFSVNSNQKIQICIIKIKYFFICTIIYFIWQPCRALKLPEPVQFIKRQLQLICKLTNTFYLFRLITASPGITLCTLYREHQSSGILFSIGQCIVILPTPSYIILH